MHSLRYRQIHLDFHTSPEIPEIGTAFDATVWQDTLRLGHVDSITCFAKCHHGWSYHPTTVGAEHPHLNFDLLRAQMDASKAIDVNVPVYISAGVDNVASVEHPEWREISADGQYQGWTGPVINAGFHTMCFNTPYLDYLCDQIKEVVRLFPEADGIFLDIIAQGPCCCRYCLALMDEKGWDATVEDDRLACAKAVLERYYQETTAACRVDNPDMPVFHNSGHIKRGQRDILKYFSHLELESLPTGGWGYDHFPLSAKYCQGLDHDFLGMTGKFHTTWGEFGGYKHPDALRYECAAMLAWGAKCSVGDQLHPNGALDRSTYGLIGAAYAEVEAKEPWCNDAQGIADIGLLSCESVNATHGRGPHEDTGAARILLEGHFLFDVIDAEMPFAPYKVLILPDSVCITDDLKAKLNAYLAEGGKLLLTGRSGFDDRDEFVFDIGARFSGDSPYEPDYILPIESLRAGFVESPVVMYRRSKRLKAVEGTPLGDVYDPYFNRDFRHFCSHQHTPFTPEPSGFHLGVQHGNITYLAHPIFTIYAAYGAVVYKDMVVGILQQLLGDERTVRVNLPSTGRVSLTEQPQAKRYVLHLLHATTINRGGLGRNPVEVIDGLEPVYNTEVTVKLPKTVTKVTAEPSGETLPLTSSDGGLTLNVSRFTCHQMLALHY